MKLAASLYNDLNVRKQGAPQMFARTFRNRIYHRTSNYDRTTVCGLRVSAFVRGMRSGTGLQLISEPPPNYEVCRHGAKVINASKLPSKRCASSTQQTDQMVSKTVSTEHERC